MPAGNAATSGVKEEIGVLQFDHLALAAQTLEEGVAHVEECLGVRLQPGGKHALMGTHNALLGLGGVYFEVIAIDPEAPPPGRPRWFALDDFSGPPRITGWIVRTEDLEAARAAAPPGIGTPIDLARGDLRWRMLVPDDGYLPFDGLFPAIIAWQGAAHPARLLAESGCRLRRMELIHPEAEALKAAMAGLLADERIAISPGPAPAIAAEFDTPGGPRRL